MARHTAAMAASLLLMVLGAHAAAASAAQAAPNAKNAKPAADGATFPYGNRPPYGNVPPGLANYDVTTLQPALPLLPQISMDSTMALVGLAPLVNVPWLKKVLPYLKGINSTGLAEYMRPVIGPLQETPPATIGVYIDVLKEVKPDTLVALAPAALKLDPKAVRKMVPALNALDPAQVKKLAELAAKLTPQTYDALVNVLNLGSPAVNAAAAKLSMLPFVLPSVAPPPPFKAAGASAAAASAAAPAAAKPADKRKLWSALG